MRRRYPASWNESLKKLNCYDVEICGRFERWLARGIRGADSAALRFRFAQVAKDCEHRSITSAYLRGAKDQTEHVLVRGLCLEGLAGAGCSRGKRRRKIQAVVLECLRDPDANVRFWACFAASGNRLSAAQSILHELKDDPGISDMGVSVGYEATEALKSIQGKRAWEGNPPTRKSPYPSLV